MVIDKKRIAAVRMLEAQGWGYVNGEWQQPVGPAVDLRAVADRLLMLLQARAEALVGCIEGSAEAAELEAVADVLDVLSATSFSDLDRTTALRDQGLEAP